MVKGEVGVSEWEKVVSEVLCHGQYNGHVWCTAMRVGPYKDFPTDFVFRFVSHLPFFQESLTPSLIFFRRNLFAWSLFYLFAIFLCSTVFVKFFSDKLLFYMLFFFQKVI